MKRQIKIWLLAVSALLLLGCGSAVEEVPLEALEQEVMVEVELVVPEIEVVEPEVEPEPEGYNPAYKYVALTFDDGPVAKTETLLDGLAERDVKVTFCCLGVQAVKYPEILTRIYEEGHQLANHSYSHLNMTKVDEAEWQADFQSAEDTFNAILGLDETTTYWLRPPYGLINRSQYSSIDVPMVLWSVDPRDWDSKDADAVVTWVMEKVGDFDIILLHDTYSSSIEAAFILIDTLTEMDYRFVTVEQLLEYADMEPEAGVIYRAADGASDSIWYGNDYQAIVEQTAAE